MGMTGPMPPHCEEFLIRTYSSHSCTSNRSCASPTRSRRRTGRSAPRRDDDCFGTDGRGTASAVDRRGRNRPRGPPVPARHPGTAGCGRPVGGLLSRRAARAERWVRRCRRILRHLRIRHHRAPAQRARDVGSDFTDRFLRATQPTHHSSRHGGHHRHRRADLREGRRCFGAQTATDARWTAVFLANFHFASIGTDYLTAQLPPSPLQNFWSLAVEEQFYLVYPTLFLLVAGIRTRWSMQARLSICLAIVTAVSFTLSVVQTASSPTVAYFSPFTRAWELAIGALIAVSTKWLLAIPKGIAASLTWVGLAGNCVRRGRRGSAGQRRAPRRHH